MTRFGRLLSVAAASGLAALSIGCGGGDVPAPTSYGNYNATNGDFAVDYPDGWEVSGHGKKNHVVTITKGGAKIVVKSNLTGSLIGDIAGSGMSMMTGGATDELDEEALEDLEPVAQVHQLGLDQMAEEIGNYSEEKAESFSSQLGEGRMSEFKGKKGLGGQLRGVRATLLSRDKCVVVICTCSPSNFDALKPAFKKVLESVSYGTAEL